MPLVPDPIVLRALADSGASSSFISETAVKRLGLERRRLEAPMGATLALGSDVKWITEYVDMQWGTLENGFVSERARFKIGPLGS
jgi:predicted aspartyl protease